MSELISGKEAWLALYDGIDIQVRVKGVNYGWLTIKHDSLNLGNIKSDHYEYRIKPQTITLNSIEVPAPFKPKGGEWYFIVNPYCERGYSEERHSMNYISLGAWRTEEEIKQVVKALRSIFNAN